MMAHEPDRLSKPAGHLTPQHLVIAHMPQAHIVHGGWYATLEQQTLFALVLWLLPCQVHKGYHMQLRKFVAVKRVNAGNKVCPHGDLIIYAQGMLSCMWPLCAIRVSTESMICALHLAYMCALTHQILT